MDLNGELKGLCMSCNHAKTCVFLAQSTDPIWRCGEFDPSGTMRAPTSPVDLTNQPLGLCVNCERLPTCSLPKAEGGVWSCDEFK